MPPQNGLRAWYWKTRDCMQLQHLDVALATSEYLQNVVAQALKQTPCLPDGFWSGEDMRQCTAGEQLSHKHQLMKECPGLLSGPHGAHIAETSSWLPAYVLRATLSLSTHDTDFKVCVVLWKHSTYTDPQVALSFYNNHIDASTALGHFVIDGATTGASARAGCAGAEFQGFGFIHAGQVLLQEVDRYRASLDERARPAKKRGVSFRVGHQIAELQWKTSNDVEAPVCCVAIQDLTPLSLSGTQRRSANNPDLEAGEVEDSRSPTPSTAAPTKAMKKLHRSIAETYRWRVAYKLAETASGVETATEPSHEVPLAQPDEVVITVLGLPPDLTPEYVFSGIYGVIPPPQSWCIPSRTPQSPRIQFYTPHPDTRRTRHPLSTDQPPFYYRDRLIPCGPPLNRLGVNYVGNLSITPDRTTIITSGALFDEYRAHLSAAADLGFRTMPDLAVELALDILTDQRRSDGTICRVLHPADAEASEAYRVAFVHAWRQLDAGAVCEDGQLYPTCGDTDEKLVQQLGLVGRQVSERVREILTQSGAFPDIQTHAESRLLHAPPSAGIVVGVDRLTRMLAALLPETDGLSVRRYAHPGVVWDTASRTFVMGSLLPACEEHGELDCLCWLGPHLEHAVSSWNAKQSIGEPLSQAEMWRAYARGMEGTADMREPGEALPAESRLSEQHTEYPPAPEQDYDDNDLGYLSNPAQALCAEQEATQAYRTPISPPRETLSAATPSAGILAVNEPEPQSVAVMLDGIEDMWQTMRHRFEDTMQAVVTQERAGMEKQLGPLTAKTAHLEATLAAHVDERESLLSSVETKEHALLEQDLLMQDKDEVIRARTARVAALKQTIRANVKRNEKLERKVKLLESRERERALKLQAGLDALKRRVTAVFGDKDEDEEDDEQENTEPPRKRTRLGSISGE